LIESRIEEQVEKLLTFIGEQDSKPFDPSYILAKSVADVICGITFGRYFNSSHPQFEKFLALTSKFFTDTELNDTLFALDLFPVAKYLPFKAYKENQLLTEESCVIIRQIFRAREKDFDVNDPVDDLMTGLLKARHEAECEDEEEKQALLSEDYMINTLDDMFSAGYETTSTTLGWAILFLVNNPQYQSEIQEALDEVSVLLAHSYEQVIDVRYFIHYTLTLTT
jgi:cytochrome P450